MSPTENEPILLRVRSNELCHKILSNTREEEVNKNALGINMQHDNNNTIQSSNFNSLFLHLVAITMGHHYIWINSFLEMATKVHIRTYRAIYEVKFWRNIKDWIIQPIENDPYLI